MGDYYGQSVVCNTGPVLGLTRAGLGLLLIEIFSEVILPQAVVVELRAKEAGDTQDIARLVQSCRVTSPVSVDPLLMTELDAGEAAVIQTARNEGIPRVLIDERKARRIASNVYDLEVRGTCGFLLEAKKRKLIQTVRRPLMDMLEAGYFIGPVLMKECLSRAGE
jgi:predicted nucleic acid-binding protein